jgi:ribosomal protein S18 acetylase RimI-like enzyme
MAPTNRVILREFDPVSDRLAMQTLDTAFCTDALFEVQTEGSDLVLHLRHLPVPRRKQFTIDLQTTAWQAGTVAVSDQALCGFIATEYQPWNRRLAIRHFYVDSKFRKRGIGRRLMQEAVKHGLREGAVTVWVETSNVNSPGVLAYQQLGFSLCGFDLTLYRGTLNADEFALFLAAPIQRLM